ncbi:MAG: DUF1579 family protein [Arenimonas sp.]
MFRSLKFALLPLTLAAVLPTAASGAAKTAPPKMTAQQQAMMQAYQKAGTPGAAHAAMAAMQGNYDLAITSWEAPGQPPVTEKGTATRKMMLDGRVMTEDMHSSMHGQPFSGHGMQGYDNVSGKHWSTWNDSMSTGVMVSEGSCDAKGACTFTGSWNDPIKKGKTAARMTTRWTNPRTEIFEMFGPGADGKEMKMMEITYTRRGK